MANKIGIVLALDGEQKFTQGMKNAQQASKQLDSQLRELKSEFKDSGNSMEFMAKKQEILKQKEEAYQRTLTAAKAGQSNAKKAYKEQAQALEDLEKQLNEAREALSKMSSGDSGYTKQAREVERLSAAVDKQTANYLKAEGRLSSWDNKVNKAESDIRKNSSALEKNAADMSKASSEGGKLADSMDDIGKEADGASKSIKDVGISLGTMAKAKAVDLAGDAMRELGEKAVEAAKYVVEVGSEFEASMSEVEAISGASGQALDQMNQKAKSLGASTRFSASEVAQGFKYMSLAGWETEQMLASIDGVVNLAAAGQMELGEASDMVTDYLSAFGLEAEKAGQMADQMAYAQANSNTSVTQLGEAYQNCAANLHAAGQDMETVTSLLEAMANQGTKGHQAGTQLSAMMRDISQKMKNGSIQIGKTAVAVQDSEGNFRDLTDILRDVEAATEGMGTAEKTAALQKTFTAKSIRAVNQVLTEGVDKVARYENELRNADGTAAAMAATMQDNLKGAMTEMGSAAEGLGIAIYEKFSGALTGLVDLGTSILGGLTDVLTPDTQPLDDYMDAIRKAQKEADGITISPTLSVMDLATDDPTGLQKYLDGIKESGDTISKMALDPDVSGLQDYIDEIKEAGDSLNATREAATEYMNASVNQAALVGALGDRLMALNEIEEKSTTQRYEMRTLVQELSQFVPELASAYDEEAGSINMTTKEVEALIKAKQRQMIMDAQAATQQEVVNELYKAETELMKAEEARAAAWEAKKSAQNQREELEGMKQAYSELTDVINDTTATEEEREAALQARAGIIKRAEEMNILVTSETSWQDAISDSIAAEQAADAQHHEAYDAWRTLRNGIKGATDEVGQWPDATKRVLEAMGLLEDETENVSEATEETGEAAKKSLENVLLVAEAVEEVKNETGETLIPLGEFKTGVGQLYEAGMEAGAGLDIVADKMDGLKDIAKASADGIREAWAKMVDDAKGSLSFDLFSDFEGGTDQTVEEMNQHMQSQIEGLQNYANNLQTVSQHVGKEISPEFMSYIESMGTEGANLLAHIVATLEQDNGSELLKEWSDGYMQAMDMQDQIAMIIAGDKAALTDGLRSFGSSEEDFSGLSEAITKGFAGADESMQTELQGLVETAKSVGATIPEGLTESIANGDTTGAVAKEQLEASIQGAMDGLIDVAREAGADVPNGLSEGIADGSVDVQEAYDQLIESIATSTNVSDVMTDAAKDTFTTPLANGVREGQEEVVTALTEVTEAAASAVQTDAFNTAGQDAAKKFAAGITSGATQTNTAGKTIADVAKIAAQSTVGEWQGVGVNMAAGLAAGIAAGQSNAISAAANMAAQALAAAKARLDIKSPSRKFRKEVGEQIGKGMAFGIKQTKGLVGAEAESAADKALQAATKWLGKHKKTTLAEEKYFWKQVSKTMIKGTDAYQTAFINSGFGVSLYTTKGSGKKKKKVKKDAETYYGEVMSAAQAYFDRLTMNQDMSISAELIYWQKVQKSLKKGTTAYVQAAQKIKSLKQQIGGFDVASDLLDSFEIYSELSEKALMDYWDIVRQQYALGTEDRLKADQKYLDAKEKYYKKLTDLETDYSDEVKDKQQELADAIKERAEEIAGAFDLFEEYTSESATGQELLFNMRSQAEGYKFWMDQLGALGSRGILSEELMDQLTQKGPGESAAIYALNSLSDQELAEYNRAFQTKMDLARQQATEDESDLASQISKEIESLTSTYQTDLANVNANLNSEMATLAGNIRSIAQDQTAQIVAAIVGNGVSASQAVTQAQQASAAQAAAESAAAAAADKAAWAEKIRAVVSSGKKTTKTNSKYNDLRNFIISTFGYDIGEIANNGLYEKLGKLFGISVNKTSTGAQRTAILRAIRGKGFRSGTKRVPVWMDEEGPGSEMVISRSDNAILTRVPAGSAIAPANLTDNLWQWGAFAPAQMMAQIERQQAALARYVTGIVGSTASMASMNGRLVVDQPQISAAGSGDAAVLATIADLLSRYLPGIEENRDVYVGAQKVTSAISDQMSNELAMRSRRRRR